MSKVDPGVDDADDHAASGVAAEVVAVAIPDLVRMNVRDTVAQADVAAALLPNRFDLRMPRERFQPGEIRYAIRNMAHRACNLKSCALQGGDIAREFYRDINRLIGRNLERSSRWILGEVRFASQQKIQFRVERRHGIT